MDIRNFLREYKKKTIDLNVLMEYFGRIDYGLLHSQIEILEKEKLLQPIKTAGTNGRHPCLYERYRILLSHEDEALKKELREEILKLKPAVLAGGYLYENPKAYEKNKVFIKKLNNYFNQVPQVPKEKVYMSKKERAFAIFNDEKALDDSQNVALLKKLNLTKESLLFYETPETFFDYIPRPEEDMTLLICENKDLWYNIRRLMFEDGCKVLFDTKLDGVVYGEGNKFAAEGSYLEQYQRFLGKEKVNFLYWGDMDREGFDIFIRGKKNNHNCSLELFLRGYEVMLELKWEQRAEGQRDEGRPVNSNFQETEELFQPRYREGMKELRLKGERIPQEIVNYIVLKNNMR